MKQKISLMVFIAVAFNASICAASTVFHGSSFQDHMGSDKTNYTRPALLTYPSEEFSSMSVREVSRKTPSRSLSPLKSIWDLNAGEVVSLSVERLLSVTEEEALRIDEDVLYELIDERAIAAYKSGKHELTAALYRIGGLWGDSDAQLKFATFLRNGEGVKKSLEESLKWHLKAAQNGNMDTISFLQRRLERNNLEELFGTVSEEDKTIIRNLQYPDS